MEKLNRETELESTRETRLGWTEINLDPKEGETGLSVHENHP